jgi:protoporphyrinogen oxidase/putative flippase GtrA
LGTISQSLATTKKKVQIHKSKPIYILGAGPAGLATAYTLAKLNYPVVVVDRDRQVGGLAKSINYQGFILDYGPHRFYTKLTPVLDLWNEVLGEEQVTVNRLTRIYYDRKYFGYPLRAKEILKTLGLTESLHIIASYIRSQLFPIHNPKNFAEWVTTKFGKRLFKIFFEAYTEKLWGRSCTEISAEWASQRIKGLSLGKAIYQAILGNNGKVKSLVEQFQFPRLGSGQLYEKIDAYLQQHKCPVLLNTEAIEIQSSGAQITQITLRNLHTGEETTVDCGAVISSIPITHLVKRISPPAPPKAIAAAESLKFRNTVLVYLIVESTQLFPDNWLYINEPTVQMGRVTNFANWSPEMRPNHNQTPLCCEYWCNFDDPIWNGSEAELLRKAEQELRKIGLLHNQKVSDGFAIKLPRTYPIYAGNYAEALSEIQAYFHQFQNLQLVGRYGSFKYNNQDHSLLMGILAAENVVTPGKHDLWATNSDSEYVEEADVNLDTTSAKLSRRSRRQKIGLLVQQFGGYLFTGGFATVVDFLVFTALTKFGLWYVTALYISYLLGLTTNFLLTSRLVFRVYWQNRLLQYLVFALVALIGLVANLTLLQFFINTRGWNAPVARLVSAACVAILSFAGHKLYSFAKNVGNQADNA